MPTGDETYTPALADEICTRLSSGETLRAICRDILRPSIVTVLRWVRDDVGPGFAEQYAQARLLGYQVMADELLDEARNPRRAIKKTIKPDGSVETVESDAVERARLHVDTLKWNLSKVLPKIYGARMDAGADDDAPLSNRPDGL